MATREYQFIVGPETSTLPAIGTPSASTDLITLGYANAKYVRGRAPVADLAALKAISDSGDYLRQSNEVVLVISTNFEYTFDADSAVAGDDDTVVQPTSGSGRWLKIGQPIPGSTDNRMPKFDGTGGKLQTTGITVDDLDNVSGVKNLSCETLTVDTVNKITTTDTEIEDKLITINKGGGAASGAASGIEVEESASVAGYVKTSADRNNWELKAPNKAGVITIPGQTGSDTTALLGTIQTFTADQTFSGALKTDTISERTATTGVTIDGVLLKDGVVGVGYGGTGQTTANAGFNALSPMTTLGDSIYGAASGVGTRLAGNTTTTKKFLTQTGDGANSAAPGWDTIIAGDIPTLNQNTTGTASNVTGTVAIANGGTGQTGQTAAFDALAPTTTKGDLIAHNGSDNVRVAVGTDGQVLKADSTVAAGVSWQAGGGGGGINYIDAGDGEATTGWTTFNDATSYADGTGGSPTATWTSSASSPLRDAKSFLFTAGGAGDGVSYAFTIDSADKAKLLQIKFDYEVVTFASFTDNDYEIWIYDVTNAVAIQPSAYQLKNSSLPNTWICNFQTASNSTSYRLSIYQKDGTTSNVRFDNISVGPQVTVQGAAVSDWVSYTPTFTGFGTPTVSSAEWRRNGDAMDLRFRFTTGTNTAVIAYVGLPSGYVIKNVGSSLYAGDAVTNDATNFNVSIGASNAETGVYFFSKSAALSTFLGTSFANSTTFIGTASVKILGWSSNTSFAAESGDGRVVAGIVEHLPAAGTIATGLSLTTYYYFQFNSAKILTDTHGCFKNTAAINVTTTIGDATYWEAPSSGFYNFNVGILYQSAPTTGNEVQANAFLYIDDVEKSLPYAYGTAPIVPGFQDIAVKGSITISLVAGQKVKLAAKLEQSGGADTYNLRTFLFNVFKIQGPSAIAAGETVAARYTNTSGSVVPNSETTLDFPTKDYDTHGAVTTGASWKFTAPISGIYSVNVSILVGSVSTISGLICRIYKNATAYKTQISVREAASSSFLSVNFETKMKLLAGEYTNASLYETVDGNTLDTAASSVSIEVLRVGNY